MKIIRDSVHGNIVVETRFVKTILDTPEFQRLRRIEQTAIRSIYPSARHDRFIHSLGVYHIGSLIVKHLQEEFTREMNDGKFEGLDNGIIKRICNSYLVACLLHDIAHAPFSHTFECYYGNHSHLFKILNGELGGKLEGELKKVDSPNYHEYASAITVVKAFGAEVIEGELEADIELVCRMIIGCFYVKEKDNHQLQNCFISLIHGDVVDADRMDYACRDVWASGYCTSSIDITRIISALHIRRDRLKDELNVCFDCNALNEISNMLDVRRFQNRYVINHHSVQYEQKLMIMAAERAAFNLYKSVSGIDDQTKALERIISIEACFSSIELPNGRVIRRISDEDLLTLIKTDKGNSYYEEYASRRYKRMAVWKTPDEFYHFFPGILRGVDLYNSKFEEKVKGILSSHGIDDVMICKVKYKPTINLRSLYVVVNGDVVRYNDIHSELKNDMSDTEKDINFYYVYVPFKEKYTSTEALREYRGEIVSILSPVLSSLYPQTQNDVLYDKLQTILSKAYQLFDDNREKQISNMSEDIVTLNDFLLKSGVTSFLDKYSKE